MAYIFKTYNGEFIEINRTGECDYNLWNMGMSVKIKYKILGFYILKWIK